MISFDSVLNFVIPAGIFLFLFALFYSKFKPTFDIMFGWIGKVFGNFGGSAKEYAEEQVIVFR